MKRSPYGIVKHPTANVIRAPVLDTKQPLPFDQWPKWATALAKFKFPEDRGVGDTIKRMLGMFGKAFEATMRLAGAPCRCAERQAEFNARFPYGG